MIKYFLFSLILTGAVFAPRVFGATDTILSSVDKSASNIFAVIEKFRIDTHEQITTARQDTKKYLDTLEKSSNSADGKPLDATEKPITYIKFFLLALALFIFSTQIVFYAALLLLLFLILRFIYRKIRNR